MRVLLLKQIAILVLLGGCTVPGQLSPKSLSSDSSLRTGDIGLGGEGESIKDIKVQGIELSGEQPSLDVVSGVHVSPEGPKDKNATPTINVISGRLLAVRDKDGRVVSWRLVGEVVNIGEKLVEAGQIVVGVTSQDSKERTLIADQVQPGEFIPIKVGERSVYDVLVVPTEEASRVSVGLRIMEGSLLERIEVDDLKFVKKHVPTPTPVSENRTASSSATAQPQTTNTKSSPRVAYWVSGIVHNSSSVAVKDITVRFWAVVQLPEVPEGAKTRDEVVAVSTWRSQQEVLFPSQKRSFAAQLFPLTLEDEQKMVTQSVELSAVAGGLKF